MRTFTYSTLAGCCDFLDSVQLGGYSCQVESFAKDVVCPIVEECFSEIEKHQFKVNDDSLKLKLVDKLRKIQQHPQRNDFKTDLAQEVIEKLEKIITTGKFGFYKLKETDSKFYGGVLHVDKESFSEAIKIMEIAGYKEEGDFIGSYFDVGGHVTTIFSKELSENYEHIIEVHNNFIQSSENATLKPISIKYGYPQAGILSKAVVIEVASSEIESYRRACGLRELSPTAHISIFSKVVKTIKGFRKQLQNIQSIYK